MTGYIGAIDQGTAGTRFVVFDRSGRPVAESFTKLAPERPAPRRVEYDPEELWGSATDAVQRGLTRADIGADALDAIGVTNQRQTTVIWERGTGRPVGGAISWQDRRIADRMATLDDATVERIRERTGLVPDPYFAASKLAWLLEDDESLRDRASAGDVLFGTVDSWLVYNLTGEHVTDVTNAAQTMLFDIHDLAWDENLLDAFDVPRQMLPDVRASSDPEGFGRTDPGGVLAAEIPVTGVIGDQQASLVGQAGFEEGDAKVTYGSGNFFLQNTGAEPIRTTEGLLTTIWFQRAGEKPWYGLEGPVFSTGAILEWLEEVGLLDEPGELASRARSVDSAEGVFVVPGFGALGAPAWDAAVGTSIVGVSRRTRREHVVRAAVESIAYGTRAVVEAAEAATGVSHGPLRVDGGAVYDDDFAQLQADAVGRSLERPVVTQTTALGAAFAAGLAVGTWDSVAEIGDGREAERTIEPAADANDVDRRYQTWQSIVEHTRSLRSCLD